MTLTMKLPAVLFLCLLARSAAATLSGNSSTTAAPAATEGEAATPTSPAASSFNRTTTDDQSMTHTQTPSPPLSNQTAPPPANESSPSSAPINVTVPSAQTTKPPMNASVATDDSSTSAPTTTTAGNQSATVPPVNATMFGNDSTTTPTITTPVTTSNESDAGQTSPGMGMVNGSTPEAPRNETGSFDQTTRSLHWNLTEATTLAPRNDTATVGVTALTSLNATMAMNESMTYSSTGESTAYPAMNSTMSMNESTTHSPMNSTMAMNESTIDTPMNSTMSMNESTTHSPMNSTMSMNESTVHTPMDATTTVVGDTTAAANESTTSEPVSSTSMDTGSTTAVPETTSPEAPESSSAGTSPAGSTGGEGDTSSPENVTSAGPPEQTTQSTRYPTKRPEKPFVLTFPVSLDSEVSNVRCKPDCTEEFVIRSIRVAFHSLPGFLYARLQDSGSRRKRDTTVTVDVVVDAPAVVSLTEEQRKQALLDVLANLTSPPFFVSDAQSLADRFAALSSSECNVRDTCALGYECRAGPPAVCVHKCEDVDCGDHGTCTVVVTTAGAANSSCQCDADDEKTYSGRRCQDSEMSKERAVAITGGVLGALCAALLILLIVVCCCRRGDKDRKYTFTDGYSNEGYSGFDMQKL